MDDKGHGEAPLPDNHSAVATSELILRIGAQPGGPTITLEEIATGLGERSFGVLLLILAILGWIPVLPPGVASIFGIAILALAVQLIFGRREPALPGWIYRRAFKREAFRRGTERVAPAIKRIERVTRPRLQALTTPAAESLVGVFIAFLALLICIPLPMTNAFPALAVAVIAIAFIQQDGLLTVVGIVLGLLAVAAMIAFWGGAYLGIRWAAGT